MPSVRPSSTGKNKGVKRVRDLELPSVDMSSTTVCKSRKRVSFSGRDTCILSELPESSGRQNSECFSLGKDSTKESENNNKKVWFSSSLINTPKSVSLSFSSRRVRVAGYVDDYHVDDVTIDLSLIHI